VVQGFVYLSIFSIDLRFVFGKEIVIDGNGKFGCGFNDINLALNVLRKSNISQAVELGSIS
jgi:hypothetical protein